MSMRKQLFLYTAGVILVAAAGGGAALAQVPAVAADTLVTARRPATAVDSLAAAQKSKNPTGAMLRSMAVPGWGQWYNEKRFKAVVVMGGEMGLVIDAIVQNQLAARSEQLYQREYYRNNRSLAIWWLGAVILYSMADAYVDAHLFGFDERPELTLGPAGPGREVALQLAVHF